MDGWMDGWMDGPAGGRTDGQTDRQIGWLIRAEKIIDYQSCHCDR